VNIIAKATPSNRQTLLFSATFEGKVMTIAKQLLRDPARVQLAANHDRHASIEQRLHHADDHGHKHNLLSHYLNSTELSQAVIFTATKRGADKLAKRLADQGHTSAALHGDMGQGARKRTVEQMRRGKFRLLVATDVASRGLDIKGISHVINYDLPMVAEDYIHRIGRTGRAGATGTAISLVGPEDWGKLHGIERLTGRKLEREIIAGLEPTKSEPKAGRKPGGNGSKRKRFSSDKPWSGKPRRSNGGRSNGSAAKGRRNERRPSRAA